MDEKIHISCCHAPQDETPLDVLLHLLLQMIHIGLYE